VKKNLEPLLASFGPFANSPPVVILDPGHGGANTGARSVANGQFEKEFTLDWARRLVSLLERKGWRVFLTRTNDADMTLAERVAFADQHNAALFLSLHFNSVDTANNQTGIETYCLTPAGMSSNLTRGYDDDVARVFPNNAFDAQNLQWAMRLHRALLAVNGGADRGVRRARFLGVLRGQNRPAVLLEGGYLSNPNETRLIADPAYRQKLAEAVATALE
jgi:N-acetylmuramoyl-L-alanine amidase